VIKINKFLENRFKANRDKSITELRNKTESYTTASLDLMFSAQGLTKKYCFNKV